MTTATGEDGEFGYRPLLDAVMETLVDLSAMELVSEDELHRMAIPIVGRRARDFLSPFAPSGTFEKLSIADLEVFDAEDRFWSQYQIDKDARLRQTVGGVPARVDLPYPGGRTGRTRPRSPRSLRRRTLLGVAARIAAAPARCRYRWRWWSSRRAARHRDRQPGAPGRFGTAARHRLTGGPPRGV